MDGTPVAYGSKKAILRNPGGKTLKEALICPNKPFIDFLSKCFIWDPNERITPEQALKHKWIDESAANPIRISLAQMQGRLQIHNATHRKMQEDEKLNKGSIDRKSVV